MKVNHCTELDIERSFQPAVETEIIGFPQMIPVRYTVPTLTIPEDIAMGRDIARW